MPESTILPQSLDGMRLPPPGSCQGIDLAPLIFANSFFVQSSISEAACSYDFVVANVLMTHARAAFNSATSTHIFTIHSLLLVFYILHHKSRNCFIMHANYYVMLIYINLILLYNILC